MPRNDAWFWETQGGTELNFFVQPDRKRVGFELKFADTLRMIKSLASALKDLRLDSLIVVKPSGSDYQLSHEIKVMSLKSALLACGELMRRDQGACLCARVKEQRLSLSLALPLAEYLVRRLAWR